MLARQFVPKERNFTFKSGHIYKFKYRGFQNDPEPLIFLLYGVKGQHPKTGRFHQYLLAINLSYINRNSRKHFVKHWVTKLVNTRGNVPTTYKSAVTQFPYMIAAVRRYLLDIHLIDEIREIPLEMIGEEVVGTMFKDFSKQAILEMTKNWRGESNATKMKALEVSMGKDFGGKVPDLGTGFIGKVLGIAKEVTFGGKI